jgi:hypothetical protein
MTALPATKPLILTRERHNWARGYFAALVGEVIPADPVTGREARLVAQEDDGVTVKLWFEAP